MSGEMGLADRLAAAFALPVETPADVTTHELAALRGILAQGLGTGRTKELRAYASLAHRFGHHADVWNATQLLARVAPLDPHARRLHAEAWLELFPATARRRPHVVLSLLEGDPAVPDTAVAALLTKWVRRTSFTPEATSASIAAEDLVAVHHVATARWSPNQWPELAPAFTAAYVDAGRRLAAAQVLLGAAHCATLATAWATALALVDSAFVPEDDAIEVVDEGAAGPVTVAPTPPADPDALRATAERLGSEKRRVWVVGALKAKWHDLLGVAKKLGVPSSVFTHVGYDEVKQKPMLHRINVASDVGILIGPVPHSANGVGHYGSLVSQLQQEAGLPVMELRANSQSNELAITKQSFRSGLLALLTQLAADMAGMASVVAGQGVRQINT